MKQVSAQAGTELTSCFQIFGSDNRTQEKVQLSAMQDVAHKLH